MSNKPEERGFLFENLLLAWNRLSIIRKIVQVLKNRKVYSQLPETVKDDIEAIEDTAAGIREDVESTRK